MSYPDVTATVGRTPLVELGRLARGLPGRVLAKLEMRNPCGSVKDRVGVALIDDAERRGTLQPGTTLVEATGGNTGIGLAFVAAVKGYKLILTMPETMSLERRVLLLALGAEIVLTPGPRGMTGAILKANEKFHLRLAEFAGNQRVVGQLALTLGYVSRLDTLCTQTVPGWIGHASILRAVEARQPAESRHAMSIHIDLSRDKMIKLFSS